MAITDLISTELYNYINRRFDIINALDEKGKETTDLEKIRIIGFDYHSKDDKSLGSIVVSLLNNEDEKTAGSLKVYYGKDLSNNVAQGIDIDLAAFLKGLRRFSKAHLLGFDVRDINKKHATHKQLAVLARRPAVHESKFSAWEGTMRTSSQMLENVKIIIKHSRAVNPEIRGARSRKIHKIYLLNPNGERFLMPFTNIRGARVMARHILGGGNPYDEIGSRISELVHEALALGKFIRRTKNKSFLSSEAGDMIKASMERYFTIKKLMNSLISDRGFSNNLAQLKCQDQYDEPEMPLKNLFTRDGIDEQLEYSLPYVWKAYQMTKLNENVSLKRTLILTDPKNNKSRRLDVPTNIDDSRLSDFIGKISKKFHVDVHYFENGEYKSPDGQEVSSEKKIAMKHIYDSFDKSDELPEMCDFKEWIEKTAGDALVDEDTSDQLTKTLTTKGMAVDLPGNSPTTVKPPATNSMPTQSGSKPFSIVPVKNKPGQAAVVAPNADSAKKAQTALGDKKDVPILIDPEMKTKMVSTTMENTETELLEFKKLLKK